MGQEVAEERGGIGGDNGEQGGEHIGGSKCWRASTCVSRQGERLQEQVGIGRGKTGTNWGARRGAQWGAGKCWHASTCASNVPMGLLDLS